MSKIFFKTVQQKRKEMNVSQEKLAEILDISTVKVSNMENGEAEADLDLCLKAAGALDIPVVEIFRGHEDSYFDTKNKGNRKIPVMVCSTLIAAFIFISALFVINCYKDYKTDNVDAFVVLSCEDGILCLKKREPADDKEIQNRYYISVNENLMEECEALKAGDVIYIHYYIKLRPEGINSGNKIESLKLCNELKVM